MNYTNKGNKPTKTGFGEGVLAAAQKDNRVVGLGADITNSVGGWLGLEWKVPRV